MSAAVGLGLGRRRAPGPSRCSASAPRARYSPRPAPAPPTPALQRVRRAPTARICPWPAPSTAPSPWTGWPRCSGLDREDAEPGGDAVAPALPRRRTHPRPAGRLRAADRPAPRHHTAATPRRRLRGRRRHRAARAGRGAARLRPRPRRARRRGQPAAAHRRRRPGPHLGRDGTTPVRPPARDPGRHGAGGPRRGRAGRRGRLRRRSGRDRAGLGQPAATPNCRRWNGTWRPGSASDPYSNAPLPRCSTAPERHGDILPNSAPPLRGTEVARPIDGLPGPL